MSTKHKSLEHIQLTGQQINGEFISCTGIQLVRILEVIQSFFKGADWYVADVSANNSLSGLFSALSSDLPLKVGDTDKLIQLTTQIDQFLSGIFLYVPCNISNPVWSRSFDTEDEPMDSLGDVLIEIRAFDTSYFEIYASTSDWIEIFVNHFLRKK